MSTVRELNLACEERDTLVVLADIRRRQRLELQKVIAEHEEWERRADRQAESVYGRLESICETHCGSSAATLGAENLLNAIEAKLNELARELSKATDSNEWLANQLKTEVAAITDRDKEIERLQAQILQMRDNAEPDHEVEP